MTANESLRDSFISHAVYFERYKTHEVNQLFRVLDEANRAAKAVVLKTDGAATKARYQAIMKEIATISAQARESMDGQLRLDLVDLIGSENEFVQKAVRSAVGVNLDMTLPAPKQVFTAATFMPFSESSTFETMLNDIDSNLYSTWDMSIRTGYLTGETAQSINRRVLGSVSGLQVGTMAKLKRGLEANTRTMIAHYAEQTRDAIYRENNDLFQGYKRLETLDTKTCLVCGAEDGKVYKSLDLAPTLPAHLNCRGLYIPLLKNWQGLGITERASVDGVVPGDTDYETWLKDQPADRQKDILGPSKYELFKNGAPLKSFVVDGRSISLKQWREVEGNKKYDFSTVKPKTEYTPAKTVKEAEVWAKENLGVRFAGYGKVPIEVVNEWQKGAYDNISRFPELKKTIKDIGTNQELRRNYIEKYVSDCFNDPAKVARLSQFGYKTRESQEIIFKKWGAQRAGKTAGNTWATSYSDPSYRAGVGINEKWAKLPDTLKKNLDFAVEKGFHPPGCNTVKSIIDHEMGHEIDKMLNRLSDSVEFDKIIEKVDIKKELCEYPVIYANESMRRKEILAEAWSEYLNNETPRSLSKQIGELIEAKYEELFGGNQ